MNSVRCSRRAFRWLVELCGPAALMALLTMLVLSTWGLVLATAVQSGRERKRFERLREEAQRRNEIADARSRAMLAEADRLLSRAREGDTQRRETRDRRM